MQAENDLKPIRLLLIEDNPVDVRLVRERLAEGHGVSFEIESSDRLERGLELLRAGSFDLVLLDLSLPDSTGGETIAHLHRQAPQVPIVALTGLDDSKTVAEAIKNGAEDYLVKGTFKTEILIRAIIYAIDRKRVRDELVVARDSAIESARLRAEFLANMSHEIRTPLNGVIGMMGLLVDTELSADQREMVEVARASGESLLRIVNDILDFSKISAGKTKLEEADFDLGLAVEGVVVMFDEAAHAKGVALEYMIDGDVARRFRGDAGRLRQILTNLIGNAIKFTAQGTVTIHVGCVSESENESVLRFQIRDTGIGIPLDGQRIIFNAFMQAETSITRRFGGTGLGLAISSQLVELMGGSIGVESAPGGGSTFWFTASFRRQPAADGAGIDHLHFERVRVLVAESSPNSARMIGEHLAAWKMRASEVVSSAQALAALNDAMAGGDPFEIAIIDLRLPESGGLALARTIKDNPRLANIRVLGLYALDDRPSLQQAQAAGVDALLARPLRQSRMCNALAALMATPTLQLALLAHRPRRSIKSRAAAEIRCRTRILLVEDNLINQQVAMRMIERIGYQADAVDNGRSALEILAHSHYDLILMDCQMPEVDGYTASREIRRREGASHHTPIIGLTARALAGDREICVRAGMDDYLSKPVMPEDLCEIIDKWVIAGHSSDAAAMPPKAPESAATANGSARAERSTAEPVVNEAVIAELREYQKPGEADFVTELIGIFEEDLLVRLNQIRAGVKTMDALRVSQAAHALKGASGELGAAGMREICSRLESSTGNGSIVAATSILPELEAEAERVRVALATYRVDAPAPVAAPRSIVTE